MEKLFNIGKPSGVFAWYEKDIRHPAQVVRDPFLTPEQKREFLADWASDRRAAPNNPEFRLSTTGALAAIDDILAALSALDEPIKHPTMPHLLRNLLLCRSKRPMGEVRRVNLRRRNRNDDDDDPPPVPAGAPVPLPPAPDVGAELLMLAAA